MSGEKVVDLASKRLIRTLRDTPVVGQPERVPIIACAGCSAGLFQLAHDRRIICATCQHEITGIWWDDHGPTSAA